MLIFLFSSKRFTHPISRHIYLYIGSQPDVGSSRTRISGFDMLAMKNPRIRCWCSCRDATGICKLNIPKAFLSCFIFWWIYETNYVIFVIAFFKISEYCHDGGLVHSFECAVELYSFINRQIWVQSLSLWHITECHTSIDHVVTKYR